MHYVTQYSYIILALFVLLVSAAAAYFWLPTPAGLALVALVSVAMVAVGAVLRYRESNIDNITALDRLIGKGRPPGPGSRVLQLLRGQPFGPPHGRWDRARI